jgi:hypothetical protein
MDKIVKSLFFAILFSVLMFGKVAQAQTKAASCNQSDVQAAINSATEGQTVTLPACPSGVSWTSGVTISGKGITVQGAGAGRIVAYDVTASALPLTTGMLNLTISPTNASGTMPSISAGQTLNVHELGFIANFMQGTVNSFNSSTGALSMNITSAGGTCGTAGPPNTMKSNCKRWLIATIPQTVLINNASGALFVVTEDTSVHTTITGIKFAAGTSANDLHLQRNNPSGQGILIHDCWFLQNGSSSTMIDGNTSRGVIWNTSFESSPFSASNGQAFRTKDGNGLAMPASWTTASTMGVADTAGQNNFYIESSDFHAFIGFMDLDDNSRTVFRYNFLNNAGGASHGADTSSFGLRHFEFYNNVGIFQAYNDGSTANMNWWMFVRGGTHAVHDNTLAQISSQDWGNKGDFVYAVENLARNAGPHACWGRGGTNGQYYYAPRQIGIGRVTGTGTTSGPQTSLPNLFNGLTDAYTYVGDREPAYLWNNNRPDGSSSPLSIGFATAYTDCAGADSQSNYVQSGRDYFNGSTAKPGYTPYTYPHPLTGGTGGQSSGNAPAAPTNLNALVQ